VDERHRVHGAARCVQHVTEQSALVARIAATTADESFSTRRGASIAALGFITAVSASPPCRALCRRSVNVYLTRLRSRARAGCSVQATRVLEGLHELFNHGRAQARVRST